MQSEMRDNWRLVLGAALGSGLGVASLPFYTAGLFIAPLQREFAWSRAEAGAGNLAVTAGLIAAMPVVTWLLRRFEERWVASVSLALMGLSFAGLSLLGPNYPFFLCLYGLVAVLGAGSSPVTFTRVVTRSFVSSRGLALGLTLAGMGCAAILLPLILPKLITEWGWRSGYLSLAVFALTGAVCVPALLPSSSVYDHHEPDRPARKAATPGPPRLTFLALGFGFIAVTAGVAGMAIHLNPLLIDLGLGGEAGIILAFLGAAVLTGRLGTGFLLD